MGTLCLYFSESKTGEMLRGRSEASGPDTTINEMEMVLSVPSLYITSTGMELTDPFKNRSFQ